MACSFAKASVCRSDSLTFLASSSKDVIMYSISRHGQHITTAVKSTPEYLVAPEELISASVFDSIPSMQELGDSMGPNVVSELFCVFPDEGSTERQKTHWRWLVIKATWEKTGREKMMVLCLLTNSQLI